MGMLVASVGVLFADNAAESEEAVVQQVASVSSSKVASVSSNSSSQQSTFVSRVTTKEFWMQPSENTQTLFIYSSVVGGPKPGSSTGVLYRNRVGIQGFDVSVNPLVNYAGGEVLASYNVYVNTKYLQPYLAIGGGVVAVAEGQEVAGVVPVIFGFTSKHLFGDVIVAQYRLPMRTYNKADLSLAQSRGRFGIGFQF